MVFCSGRGGDPPRHRGRSGQQVPPRFGCRNNTCEYGVILCEEMLRYGQSKGYGTQIAMYNGGGIRASLQPGDITVEMVKQIHPFGNSLSYFTLPGSAVRGMVTRTEFISGLERVGTGYRRQTFFFYQIVPEVLKMKKKL